MTRFAAPLNILALNSGSSSLKFGLFRVGSTDVQTLLSGEAESIGDAHGKFHVRDWKQESMLSETLCFPGHAEVVVRIAKLLEESNLPEPDAVGHRVVHGGPDLLQHCLIDDSILRQLEAAKAFAPLHAPASLSVISYARQHFPGLPQVACFDTVFHAGMPEVARVLPLARELRTQGIWRYGFHGLSCESIVRQLGDDLPARLIIAHLGNGASVTAVNEGKSIDTSMALTPTGGVIMGTRSGDLDPGVLIYLMREKNYDASMIEDLVDRRSGLLGISGVASDMRTLRAAAAANPDARLAIDMFCYSVRKQIGAMVAALGGIDSIVFTGGIGENDAEARAAICAGLSWAGIESNEITDRSASALVSPSSSCSVRVLASAEDEQIARHAWALYPRSES